MCRICGRMVKCIFDSMPSRTPSIPNTRSFSTAIRSSRHSSPRHLLRRTFDIESAIPSTPPSFLVPHRAKLHQAAVARQETTLTAHFRDSQDPIPPQGEDLADTSSRSKRQSTKHANTPSPTNPQAPQPAPPPATTPTESSLNQPPPLDHTPPSCVSNTSKPLVISKSLQSLLPALHAQTPHFITTHIHRFPYLLTTGDILRLPFHLHNVSPGDILRLNRASILGSRDYTLKAGLSNHSETYDGKRRPQPLYLDERLFVCRVRVMGVESQPLTVKEKTKRRNRKVKTVKSKHRYTVCRVMEVRVKSLEELVGSKEDVVLLE